MKTLIIITLITLLACTQENQQMECNVSHTNWEMMQGYWESQSDRSLLEIQNNAMYLFTDSIRHLFSWSLTDNLFKIWTYDEPIQLTYKFNVITLNDSTLVLENTKKHYYKLRLRYL
jgi:hypothetical protein